MNTINIPFKNDLQLLHEATKIPFCVFDYEKKALLRYPHINSFDCSPITIVKCCEALNKLPSDSHFPIIYFSDFCFISLLKLDANSNVMFGPISSVPLTYHEFYTANKDLSDPDDLTHFYRVMAQGPHMSLMQFANSISLFVKLAFGEVLTAQEILSKQIILHNNATQSMPTCKTHPHYITSSKILDFHKKILSYVQNGNTQEIENLLRDTSFFINLRDTFSDEETQKFSYIFTALCCVTAIDEGLEWQKAFSIFDTYVSRISLLTTPESVAQYYKQLSIDYCQQVINIHQLQSDSPVVTKCLQYVQNNIYSKLAICDLAAHCKVSKRTITRHFSEYYHMSVYEYILQAKLKKAAFLLTHSDFSLAEISTNLSFSSQSHFCVAFKKKYYYTPLQYREKNKR